MCGIIGVAGHTPVNQVLYDGLLLLPASRPGRRGHRHQRRRVVSPAQGRRLRPRRVPHAQHARSPRPRRHRPLPLSDRRQRFFELESQPFYVNSPFGVTLAHNGNLTNSQALKRELFQLDFRHVNTNSDSEVLLNVLALELERAAHHARLDADAIFTRRGRRAPPLPRRVRHRRADRRLRNGRLPRSVRHPTAHRRRQRSDGRHGISRRERVRRARRRSAFRCCATSRRAKPSSSTRPAASTRGCAPRTPVLAPCIFEYRLPRAPRFGDRRHVGVRIAPQHGRAARAQDPRHSRGAGHRRRHPDSGFEPAVRRCSSPTRSGSRIARASSRTATSAARSSCRGRRCARRACARS